MKENLKIFSIANKRLLNPKVLDIVLDKVGILSKKNVTEMSPYKPDAFCNLRPTVIAAIAEFVSGNPKFGLEQTANSFNCCLEVKKDQETTFVSVIDTDTDELKCCKISTSNNSNLKYSEYKFEDDGGAFIVLSYMMYMMVSKKFNSIQNERFCADFNEVCNSLKHNLSIDDVENTFAFISEVVYREISLEKMKLLRSDKPIPLTKKELKNGKYIVSKSTSVSYEAPEYFRGDLVFESGVEMKVNLSDYTSVELSEQEKKMVPKIPDWYVEPKELPELVRLICCSTKTAKPKRNFMFRGPSSTGKTSLARALAAKLNKPYVYLTCSADTESYDFLGQPMYDENGKIRFVESQFISAIKNGWVVEIQEPYIIAKQGVLTALNGLLDDSNGITLSTGEYVERHPDTVVLLTTNVDYVGCRQPNQSVLRRMNGIYDIEMPSEREIKNRVKAVTKFKNDKLLDDLIEVFFKINNVLKSDDCTDGVCTVSELIDWVSTIMITASITESAESTIISKATYDKDVQLAISNLIAAKFDNVEYEI